MASRYNSNSEVGRQNTADRTKVGLTNDNDAKDGKVQSPVEVPTAA